MKPAKKINYLENQESDVSLNELNQFHSMILSKALQYKNRKGSFEENFRQDVNFELRKIFEDRDLDLSIENEFSLKGNKRIDSLIDKVIIEFKSPGLLRADNSSAKNVEAVNGSKDYIEKLSAKERRTLDRYRAFCFDGQFLIVCYYKGNSWIVEDPIPFSKSASRILLNTILAVKQTNPFTADNLAKEFGPSSKTAKVVIEALHLALIHSKNKKIKDLFMQWQVMFSQASEFVNAKNKLIELVKIYNLEIKSNHEAELLFCVHTYLALLMKLIAVDVVTLFSNLAPFTKSASKTSDNIFEKILESLERGDPFYQSGVSNFLEADYFSWYLEDKKKPVLAAIRLLFSKFEKFDVGTLSVDPFQTADLLKSLYEKLIPRAIRHDLGEYYTPDWLAEHVVRTTDYPKDATKRFLDPSCGTGTFLCIAIRNLKRHLYSEGYTDNQVLQTVLNNVVGFDLNPVAVIAARTNYLIGISTCLSAAIEAGEQVTVPVYLCDSLMSPKEDDKKLGEEISMITSVGTMTFPLTLANNKIFDIFHDKLKSSLDANLNKDEFSKILKKSKVEDPSGSLAELYNHISKLHKEGRNGIWANIIKNSFAPLLAGKFDVIGGNPPWINWEHLPEQYRNNLSSLWQRYDLFNLKGMETVLGGAKRDIATLFTYVCVDHFLNKGGKLAFVIPQTLLKNVQSAEGFRKFHLFGDNHFKVTQVDDMVDLKPFDATNRTAVIFVEKGIKNSYPVPYKIWTKKTKGPLDNSVSLDYVFENTDRITCAAKPVDPLNIRSPWLTLPSEVIELASSYLGKSPYKAIEGANTLGLNGFYFVKIKGKKRTDLLIENCRERIKVPVPKIETIIEDKFLFPLLLGREVDSFSAEPVNYILMLQDPNTRIGVSEDILKNESTKLYNLVNQPTIKKLLKQRPGFKRYHREHQPHWGMFNVSRDTFSEYKVVWREQASTFKAAVVGPQQDKWLGNKVIIPDHKLMLLATSSKDEANYVCGFLNSFIVKLIVKGYAVDTSISTHVTEFIKMPKYDPKNKLHKFFKDKSEQYHKLKSFDSQQYDTALAKEIGLDDKSLHHVWKFITA